MGLRTSKLNIGDRAAQMRQEILNSALHEFSQRGFKGARVESISARAKGNIALIYYYFTDKRGLYLAVIQESAKIAVQRGIAILDGPGSAGERLLVFALANFNRVLVQYQHEAIMFQEMYRDIKTIEDLAMNVFRPVFDKLRIVIHEGIDSGEFCELDWMLVVNQMFGATTSYFRIGYFLNQAFCSEPITSESVELRRKSIAHLLAKTVFNDPALGARLVEKALIERPMPSAEPYLDWRASL